MNKKKNLLSKMKGEIVFSLFVFLFVSVFVIQYAGTKFSLAETSYGYGLTPDSKSKVIYVKNDRILNSRYPSQIKKCVTYGDIGSRDTYGDEIDRYLVKFDLSDLKINELSGGSFFIDRVSTSWDDNDDYYLHAVDSNWNDNTVTWDNAPSFEESGIKGMSVARGLFKFDISELLKRWVFSPSTNHGFIIKKGSERTTLTKNKGLFACSTYPIGSSETRPYVDIKIKQVDLIVNQIKVYSEWGGSAKNAVVADICNRGTLDYTTSNNYQLFSWADNVSGAGIFTDDSQTVLKSGKCEEFYFTELEHSESMTYSVYIDQPNNIKESNEGNNAKSQIVITSSPFNVLDYEGVLINTQGNNDLYLAEGGQKRLIYDMNNSVYWSAIRDSYGMANSDIITMPAESFDLFVVGPRVTLNAGSKYTLSPENSSAVYMVTELGYIKEIFNELEFVNADYIWGNVVTIPTAFLSDYEIVASDIEDLCTDIDGRDYFTKGIAHTTWINTVTGSYPGEKDWEEYCDANGVLHEYYCNPNTPVSGGITQEFITCENGCMDGACVEEEEVDVKQCTDSDESGDYLYGMGLSLTEENYPDIFTKGKGEGIYTGSTGHVIYGDPEPGYIGKSPYDYSLYYDYCTNDTQLNEAFCMEDGTMGARGVFCPNGCQNGACVSAGVTYVAVACSDTDEGINYLDKGKITIEYESGLTRVENDSCNANGTLREWYCGEIGDSSGALRAENYVNCKNGCVNGACVEDSSTGLPDLIIEKVVTTPSKPKSGDWIAHSIHIKNIGQGDVVNQLIKVPNVKDSLYNLKAGETAIVIKNNGLSIPGDTIVHYDVNFDGSIKEEDYTNNKFKKIIIT